MLKYIPVGDVARRVREHARIIAPCRIFFIIVQFCAFWGVFCTNVDHGI